MLLGVISVNDADAEEDVAEGDDDKEEDNGDEGDATGAKPAMPKKKAATKPKSKAGKPESQTGEEPASKKARTVKTEPGADDSTLESLLQEARAEIQDSAASS